VILSEDEKHRVIAACMAGTLSHTEQDISRALDWAIQARVDAVLLLQVLAGEVTLHVPENLTEPPTFRSASKEMKSQIEMFRATMDNAQEDS
jgi:hypothetical protein